MTAIDHHGTDSLSTSTEFQLQVKNDPTNVGELDSSHNIVKIADKTISEDTSNPLVIDLASRDEQAETNNSTYYHDAFYEVWVKKDPSDPSSVFVPVDLPHGYQYQPNPADATQGVLGGGIISLDKETGQITWTSHTDPSDPSSPIQGPNNRDVGDYLFMVVHDDGHGSTATDTFHITISNTAPTLKAAPVEWDIHEDDSVNPTTKTHPELWTLADSQLRFDDEGIGQTYSLQIDGKSFDPADPLFDVHQVGDKLVGHVNGSLGGILEFDTKTGETSWATTNADVNADLAGNPLQPLYQFTVTATDNHGAQASTSFAVKVTNDATVIDTHTSPFTDSIYVVEKQTYSFDPTASDESVERPGLTTSYELAVDDGNGPVAWNVYNANHPSNGQIVPDATFPETGKFSWTPDNLDSLHTYTFIVTHHDGNGSADTESFKRTVLDSSPSLTVPGSWILHEDDTDPSKVTLDQSHIQSNEEGLDLTYTLYIDGVKWTPGYSPNQAQGGGVVTHFDSSTGEIQWPTTNADVTVNSDGTRARAAYEFTIVADDNHGDVVSKSFSVDVTNAPTSINNIPDHTVQEDSTLHIGDAEVYAADEKVGANSHYTLEISRDGGTGIFYTVDQYNALVTATGGAPVTFNAITGAIDWAPKNPDVGGYTFQITHDDGHTSTATDNFKVTVENTAPVFTTTVPQGQVVMATKYFTYNADSTDEGQHDWRGDDRVTYSLVQSPNGMTIDPNTGSIDWQADPKQAGTATVTIKVDDGNGGVALQTFSFIIDDLHNNLPLEHRPDTPATQTDQGKPPTETESADEHVDVTHLPHTSGGLFGATPMTNQVGAMVPEHHPISHSSTLNLEQILAHGATGLEDLLVGLDHQNDNHSPSDGYGLRQPSLGKAGSVPLITELSGYPPEVARGMKLDFSAENIRLWYDLNQPSLSSAGSVSPTAPLEGYVASVEAGSRLDFDHFPIMENLAMRLEELRVADILGL